MTADAPTACYPDNAGSWTVDIAQHQQLARDTWRVRLDAPDLARRILPGQFVMLRIPELQDPLLGRPFALYDVTDGAAGAPRYVDIVYLVKGKLTSLLPQRAPGQLLEVWGPLGNGFRPRSPMRHAVFVAGGIGQTPFVALAKAMLGKRRYGEPHVDYPAADRITMCYGARTADFLAGLADFEAAGCQLRIATDDGSRGHHGFVTDVLREVLRDGDVDWVATCGPEPMMEAVTKLANESHVPCDVSLETPMACGIGACFSCVVRIKQPDGGWDYKRTCIEGPVFSADSVVWGT